jgi:hypothetical protein
LVRLIILFKVFVYACAFNCFFSMHFKMKVMKKESKEESDNKTGKICTTCWLNMEICTGLVQFHLVSR